jgi:hypothetical protein
LPVDRYPPPPQHFPGLPWALFIGFSGDGPLANGFAAFQVSGIGSREIKKTAAAAAVAAEIYGRSSGATGTLKMRRRVTVRARRAGIGSVRSSSRQSVAAPVAIALSICGLGYRPPIDQSGKGEYSDTERMQDARRLFVSHCARAYAEKTLTSTVPTAPRSISQEVRRAGGNVRWLSIDLARQRTFHYEYCQLLGKAVPFDKVWQKK